MKLRNLIFLVVALLLQSCELNHPNQDAASYNTQLGLAYLKQGDRPRAKQKLLMALAEAPDSPQTNASMAYFMEKSGELEQAKRYYHKAMLAAPSNGEQLNNYGAFLCRQGRYAESDSYFMRAVNDPQYTHVAGAYENAGLCAAASSNNTKASRYFLKALQQDPARKQSLYELVAIEIKQGHHAEALAHLEAYPLLLRADPTLMAMAVDECHLHVKALHSRQITNDVCNIGVKYEHNRNNG